MSGAVPDRKPRMRFPGVRPPKPLLSREAETQLSARQLELLDELEAKLVAEGLGELTMAEMAREQGISRVVVDRGGFKFHGRVKTVVSAAAEAGIHVGAEAAPEADKSEEGEDRL